MDRNDVAELSVLDLLVFRQKTENVSVRARSFCAISFKAETSGAYTVNGERVEHGAGALCLIPAGVPYRRESLEENIRVIHFRTTVELSDRIRTVEVSDVNELSDRFDRVLDMWNERTPGCRYHAMGLLYELFALFVESAELEDESGDYLDAARRYMKTHFFEADLTVEKLCARSFVSPANFRRRFGKRYGVSPKQYLDKIRMDHAKALLRADYCTASEIANRCGFSDGGYFCTAFRRHTGESVTEYRERHIIYMKE